MSTPALTLNHGFSYASLFELDNLQRLDEMFLARLQTRDARLHEQLLVYRRGDHGLTALQVSDLLIACGPVLEDFMVELFGIEDAAGRARAATVSHDPVFEFKKQFVLRRARKRLMKKEEIEDFAALDRWLSAALDESGLNIPDRELAVAKFGVELLAAEKINADGIEKLTRWCIRALTTPAGKAAVKGWVSFKLPIPTDHEHLVPIVRMDRDAARRFHGPAEHFRRRDGFKLTDPRMNEREVMNEIHYCILCHDHDGDFCSKGFPEKKGEPQKGLKVNPLGVTLTGCPLDEKISEMHTLKRQGDTIAALAMIMVDNPMCPVTGHRICNDCMKGCIYQKQEPVNIPQIETRVPDRRAGAALGGGNLRPADALEPAARETVAAETQQCSGRSGMGPAGFTLAHHLLMEGFAVVGTDGLKIEPLPRELIEKPVRRLDSATARGAR